MSIKKKLYNSTAFYRAMEIVPGMITWSIIIMPFILAKTAPRVLAYFILIYTVYWLYQAMIFLIFAITGYMKARKWDKIDWLAELNEEFGDEWKDYYFAILIPFAKETERVLVPTMDAIANNKYPNDRKILVLSTEKAHPGGKNIAKTLAEKYKDKFAKIVVTEHVLQDGEIVGKSSNENWAGRVLHKKCQEWGIDTKKVMVCSNDSDISIHRHFMANVIYLLLQQGDAKHSTVVQSLLGDLKNIWDSDPIPQIRSVVSALWHASNPFIETKAFVFSHYSLLLATLEQMDFWDPDIIQEDNRVYSKGLFSFGKKFKLVHSFLFVVGEPVMGENVIHTHILAYKQNRRWSWSAAEFAYIIKEGLLGSCAAPKSRVWGYAMNYLFMHVQWVIASYIPVVATPVLLALNPGFSNYVLGRTLPLLIGSALPLTNLFLFFFVISEYQMVGEPKGKKKPRFFTILGMFAKWLLSPISGILMSSLPALDAQTRLLLNKRLQYAVYRKE